MGMLMVENNLFGERCICSEGNQLGTGITYEWCDYETEMLILTMYLKKYLKKSNTLGKYLNTNILIPKHQIQILKTLFKYFQIQMYLTPCLDPSDILHIWIGYSFEVLLL